MEILLSGVVAFAMCLLITPFLIKLLKRLKAIDYGGGRKIHKGVIPTMGGLAIFVAAMATIPIFSDVIEFSWRIHYFLGAVSLMFLMGFTDDAINLKASRKLLIMIIGGTMVYMSGIKIDSLYGFFGIQEIPPEASYLITVFTIIVIINAYNLVDGIDGLASGLGITTLGCFAVWFVLMDNMFLALFCVAFTGALIAFLRYNWSPARIFMGDTGSLTIGMVCAICTIMFIRENQAMDPSDPLRFRGYVAAGATFVVYPLYDTLRVFIIRMLNGCSPLSPDTRHTHHYLLKLGYSHRKTATIILLCNVFCMALFWTMSYFMRSYYVVPIMLAVSLVTALLLQYIEKKHKLINIEH